MKHEVISDWTRERPLDQLTLQERGQLHERYHESDNIDVNGEQLLVNDLTPPVQNGNPVVFVPGYYAEGDSFRQNMYDTYLLGRRVITYNGYHGVDDAALMARYGDKVRELQELDPDADIKPQLRKAAAFIAVIESKGLQQVDVFAHSEGAIVATIAMYLRPELFGRKAFLNPAALIGEPMYGKVGMYAGKIMDDLDVMEKRLERTVWNIKEKILGSIAALMPKVLDHMPLRQVSPRYGGDINKEYAAGDSKHLDKELEALTHRKLERWLAVLPDKDSIVIGTSERDRLFPPNMVESRARQAGITQFFRLKNATHNVQHFEPAKVTEFIRRGLQIGTGAEMPEAA